MGEEHSHIAEPTIDTLAEIKQKDEFIGIPVKCQECGATGTEYFEKVHEVWD